MLVAEITILCESIRPGCTFVARMWDRSTERFYSGNGPTALEAVAWCLDDYVSRAVYGLDHTMAMPIDAKPGWRFPKTPASDANQQTSAPARRGRKKAA